MKQYIMGLITGSSLIACVFMLIAYLSASTISDAIYYAANRENGRYQMSTEIISDKQGGEISGLILVTQYDTRKGQLEWWSSYPIDLHLSNTNDRPAVEERRR